MAITVTVDASDIAVSLMGDGELAADILNQLGFRTGGEFSPYWLEAFQTALDEDGRAMVRAISAVADAEEMTVFSQLLAFVEAHSKRNPLYAKGPHEKKAIADAGALVAMARALKGGA